MLLEVSQSSNVLNYAKTQLAAELLERSEASDRNPAALEVIDYVSRCLEQEHALNIIVSVQPKMSPEFQNAKLAFRHGAEQIEVASCFDALDSSLAKNLVKTLLDLQYPFKLTLLIDDLDFEHVYQAKLWCSAETFHRAQEQFELMRQSLQQEVEALLPDQQCAVIKWSEWMDRELFATIQQNASDITTWRLSDPNGIVANSFEILCDSIAQPSAQGKSLAFGSHKYVFDELLAQAASVHFKTQMARLNGGIHVWSKPSFPNALWPIILSNYNGAGYTASLVYGD